MINRRENWIAQLPQELQLWIDHQAIEHDVRAGEEIATAGSLPDGVHQVIQGYVKVTGLDRDGETILIALYGPGNCWSESPLVSNRPHHHSTFAMTDGRVRILPREAFQRLYAEHPIVRDLLCRKFSDQISRLLRTNRQHTTEKTSRLLAKTFCSFLRGEHVPANQYVLNLPLTQTDISNYVGISRQAIQKEVTKLKTLGIVEKSGDRWIVRDVARLRARAGLTSNAL
jgi:CRP/FNR family transcriptional regulator, cyclic AMP receptor protein